MKTWKEKAMHFIGAKGIGWMMLTGIAVVLLLPDVAFADPFSTLKTNISTTATEIMGLITAAAGSTTGTKIGWHAWMKSMSTGAGNEMNAQRHSEGIKHTLIWGGGISAVGAIATAISATMTHGF